MLLLYADITNKSTRLRGKGESIPYNAYSRRMYSFNYFLLIGFELKINEKLQRENVTALRAYYK